MVATLTNETFNSKVIDSKKTCLVDFFADLCGPCKMMSPIIKELDEKYGEKVAMYKMDVLKSREVAALYQITSVPTLHFFKNGEVVETLVGATAKDVLEEKIKSYL